MPLMDCDPPVASTFEPIEPTLTVDSVAFADTTVSQTQPNGVDTIKFPALSATWAASTNPYVTGVQFRYIPSSGTEPEKLSAIQDIGALTWVTTDGIVPQKEYDCTWRAVGINGFFGEWSSPPVTVLIDQVFQLEGSDALNQYLWTIRPNLWRFDAFSPSNGAAAVGVPPAAAFTTFGSQQMAYTIPGGASAVFLTVDGKTFGLATRDGAAYNFQFLGAVDSGTAVVKVRFLDASNNPITGVADQTFNLTTTPTVFSWVGISSDDVDFATAKLQFFTTSTSQIPSGRTVTVTDLMMENDDFGNPHGLTTPWRPSPDEDYLTRYTAIVNAIRLTELGAAPGQTPVVNPDGTGTIYNPTNGPLVVKDVPTTTYTLQLSDAAALLRATNVTSADFTVPTNASVPVPVKSVVEIAALGGVAVTISAAVGVTITGPSLSIPAGSKGVLTKVGTNLWDLDAIGVSSFSAASIAETTAGTSTAKAVTPDSLAGSQFGKRYVQMPTGSDWTTALSTGDGKSYWFAPTEFNGMDLVGVFAANLTPSTSGLPTFQVARVRSGTPVDVLTTKVSIDINEYSSATAATPPAINTSNDDVQTGDAWRIDCDIAGTGCAGATVTLVFQLP